ncbi:hypothetical protein GQ53DRAFT_61601 [Thozetella sp. PMI_491]|nr:hypothetical protein GQ53DRAFT_61601 [Thozetella sp. PMI_491]
MVRALAVAALLALAMAETAVDMPPDMSMPPSSSGTEPSVVGDPAIAMGPTSVPGGGVTTQTDGPGITGSSGVDQSTDPELGVTTTPGDGNASTLTQSGSSSSVPTDIATGATTDGNRLTSTARPIGGGNVTITGKPAPTMSAGAVSSFVLPVLASLLWPLAVAAAVVY